MTRFVLAAVLCGAAAASAEPRPVDAQQSELVVKTHAEGLAKGFAHDHVVRATELSGKVQYDPKRPEALHVSVTVKTSSLEVDEPGLRKRYGEPKPLGDKDRKSVGEAMLGDQQLDAAKFPTITFTSTGARRAGDTLVVSGDFTLHGVKKQVTVPVQIEEREGAFVGTGHFTLRTSDYGIKPYRAALGAIRNRDEVELTLRIVAD